MASLHDKFSEYKIEEIDKASKSMILFNDGSLEDLICRGFSCEDIYKLTGIRIHKNKKIKGTSLDNVDRFVYKILYCRKNMSKTKLNNIIKLISQGHTRKELELEFPVFFHPTTSWHQIFTLLGYEKEFKDAYSKHQLIILERNMINKYGVKHPSQSEIIKKRTIETNLEKYGVEYPSQSPIIKAKVAATNLERYGHECSLKNDAVQKKIAYTMINKYGVRYTTQSKELMDKIKNSFIENYGVENPSFSPAIIEKIRNTKAKNHTFSTSNPEKCLAKKLKGLYTSLKTQYSDDKRYPSACDFYIPERDLFIEYNGWYMHGKEWYTPRKKYSKDLINKWKLRDTSQTSKAIKTFTFYDVSKRKTAKQNNLNYIVLWDEKDIDKWFELGCQDGHDYDYEYSWIKDDKERNDWIKTKKK